MKEINYKNISIGLNYSTTDTENDDVIYIENTDRDGGIIVLTVDEAEMVANNLMKFAELFKK